MCCIFSRGVNVGLFVTNLVSEDIPSASNTTVDMENHINVLRARQAVLRRPKPPGKPELNTKWGHDDPFAFESRGFYSSRLPSGDNATGSTTEKKKKKAMKPSNTLSALGGIRKPEKQKARFLPNWTAERDRMLRKCLRKFGWGSWTRMEQSGKFPPNFTRKILARRVKSLGYTKDMFTAES